MSNKYRKKPVVVEAKRWSGFNWHDILAWAEWEHGEEAFPMTTGGVTVVVIKTLEGEMTAQPGDWIVRGVQGEFYPVKPDIFDATYEPA